ncbi:MAG: hypothetical protein HQK92_12615 [Nitrospirae bacterium]|nr:hypothetical protein [Nitrospirota bacterium]
MREPIVFYSDVDREYFDTDEPTIIDRSLMHKFIAEQIKDYKEPVRKGKAKRDPVGNSKAKIATALLSMTHLAGTAISDILQTPYISVKTWRAQKGFRDLTEQYCDEFSKILFKHIKSVIELYTFDISKDSKDVLSETMGRMTTKANPLEYKYYGDRLKERVTRLFYEWLAMIADIHQREQIELYSLHIYGYHNGVLQVDINRFESLIMAEIERVKTKDKGLYKKLHDGEFWEKYGVTNALVIPLEQHRSTVRLIEFFESNIKMQQVSKKNKPSKETL